MKVNDSKTLRTLALMGLLGLSLNVTETKADCVGYRASSVDAGSVLVDVVIARPLGLVGTIAGAGLFLGLAPLTALASIPEPHDAFGQVGEVLVGAPAAFTFERPVGCFPGAMTSSWR